MLISDVKIFGGTGSLPTSRTPQLSTVARLICLLFRYCLPYPHSPSFQSACPILPLHGPTSLGSLSMDLQLPPSGSFSAWSWAPERIAASSI